MDRLNHEALNDGSKNEPDDGRDNEADPEIAGRRKAEPCQHGADHEEIAVGDIDNVEQTENDRQPERDERNDQPPYQTVHRQQKYRIPHERPPTGTKALPRCNSVRPSAHSCKSRETPAPAMSAFRATAKTRKSSVCS